MSSTTYVNGVTLSDAAEWNRWDTAAYPKITGVAGTNTVIGTGPANFTLSSTQPLILIPAVTNTGATTLNITPSGGAALGAKAVFANGAACVGGELIAGVVYFVYYDGTQYNILGIVPTAGTWTPIDASGAALSFTSVKGNWARSGRMVYISGIFTYPATADGSNAKVGGLPFTILNDTPNAIGLASWGTSGGATGLLAAGNTTTALLQLSGTVTPNSNVSTKIVSVSMTYMM